MGTAITGYEIGYRVQDSGQEWTTVRIGRQPIYSLRGLRRGETYDYRIRSLSADKSSPYATGDFLVPTTHREGPLALPPVTVGNVGSRWVAGMAVGWSATDTNATIGVDPGTLQVGSATVSYNGSLGELTDGTADEVRLVHLYYDDPKLEGGTRTLGITDDITESSASYGRIYIASITITFDAAAGSGTSGGGDIGGGGGGSGQIEP